MNDLDKLFALLILFERRSVRRTADFSIGFDALYDKFLADINRILSTQKDFIDENIKIIENKGIQVITFWDDLYPSHLRQISDPPLALFGIGDISLLKIKPSIAIVGSRKASVYGLKVASKLSRRLVMSGAIVVSGGAFGIDNSAHKASFVSGKAKTIVVMGGGLKEFYPKSFRIFFNKLIDSEALIISEFLPSVRPDKYTFPRRNRIIAGLSDVIVVVEAALRSGALITASYALEQGKDVFAVPGPVDSPTSAGCNKLIYDGAFPLVDIDEFLNHLGLNYVLERPSLREYNLNSVERDILELINNRNDVLLDELTDALDYELSEILLSIASLELKGLVRNTGGVICIS